MKKIRNMQILIPLILIVVLIIASTIYIINYNNKDQIKFKKEYENLNNQKLENNNKARKVIIPGNNPIIYATAEEISKKIDNKETFAVYFGFSKCPWCRSIISNLLKAAKDLNVKKIYYIDVENIRDIKEFKNDKIKTTKKGSNGYYKLLKSLDNILDDYKITDKNNTEISVNEKRIYAPTIVGIVDGKAQKSTTGISSLQKEPYMKLTPKMNKESTKNIKEVLKLTLPKQNKTCQSRGKNVC